MKETLVESADFSVPTGGLMHHYIPPGTDLTKVAGGSMSRIARELRQMRTSLPSSFSSAILVRHDKARPYIMKACIFGPDDTPYDSGCFVFDIFCGAEYPKVSPKVNLMTTGSGRVRFNPNLYNCGKVCLSLLGTWPGEGWTPDKSTITQVLVSIQGLIFCKLPYFNEPGVESYYGTPTGVRESRINYNGGYQHLRLGTIWYAMVEYLNKPPVGFEAAVREHFRLKRGYIATTVLAWLKDAMLYPDTPTHLTQLTSAARLLLTTYDAKYGPCVGPHAPAVAELTAFLATRPA